MKDIWDRFLVWLGFRMERVRVPEPEPLPVDDLDARQDDRRRPGNVTPIDLYRDTRQQVPSYGSPQGGVAAIHTVKPRAYNDVQVIGKAFRKGIPIIMNVTEMSDAEARRLVDFAAGLSYGLEGRLEKVITGVFVLTPSDVEYASDTDLSSPERSFYDMS